MSHSFEFVSLYKRIKTQEECIKFVKIDGDRGLIAKRAPRLLSLFRLPRWSGWGVCMPSPLNSGMAFQRVCRFVHRQGGTLAFLQPNVCCRAVFSCLLLLAGNYCKGDSTLSPLESTRLPSVLVRPSNQVKAKSRAQSP